MEEPDERYEKIPWEHLMPSGSGTSRRAMWAGGVVLVTVGVVAFLAGSRAIPPIPAAAAPPPSTSSTAPPMIETPAPLPSEADLRAPADGVGAALAVHLAEALTAPGVWVDDVSVEALGDGSWLAAVSLFEVVDGAYRRVPPLGLMVRPSSTAAGRVVVDSIEPAPLPDVAIAEAAGAVDAIPDPVGDALVTSLAPWPGATISRAGVDAGRWWVEVAVPLPGGSSLTTVLWPALPVGLGSGG